MRDFATSTLWRASTFHAALDSSNADTLPASTLSSVTTGALLTSLRRLQAEPHDQDLLALLLVCVRQQEPVLLFMEHGPWIWPLSIYPASQVYHSPRELSAISALAALSRLKLLGVSRPVVKDPARALVSDDLLLAKFRPLPPLLGALALHGPRSALLAEIGGRAAYRLSSVRSDQLPALNGALAAAVAHLKRETVALKDIARWPGMNVERACRLLNALYLAGALIVSRSHSAARDAPGVWLSLRNRLH